jgi:hypothetical protein
MSKKKGSSFSTNEAAKRRKLTCKGRLQIEASSNDGSVVNMERTGV